MAGIDRADHGILESEDLVVQEREVILEEGSNVVAVVKNDCPPFPHGCPLDSPLDSDNGIIIMPLSGMVKQLSKEVHASRPVDASRF